MLWSNCKIYKFFCKRIHNIFTLSSVNTHLYIYIYHTLIQIIYISVIRKYTTMPICSASRTLNHLCPGNFILTHSSKFNTNIVLQIYSSQNSSYQNTPLKPHMQHNIED